MRARASTEIPPSWRLPGVAALAAQLRVPLYRDGYALALNSVLSALLGVAFWLLAARNYPPYVVGVNTAAISAMMFLAGLAQLNLMSALVRFLPVLGGKRARFVTACYAVACAAGVACAAIFLIGVHVWSPALGAFGAHGGMAVWFVAATAAWCLFNLQDSALTGLGAAVLVPVDNLIFGVAKIVLLVVLVSVSPHFGIFASWSAALIVSLLPMNAVIFGRLVRRPTRAPQASGSPAEAPSRRDIVSFVAPDYLGALLWLAATTLMPVIVIGIAGATSNAFYSLAWMIAAPLFAISAGTGAVLVTRSASDPARLSEYAVKVLRQTARLVVPAALVAAVAAPYILRVFGRQYAAHAAPTLAVLALSAIPNMLTSLYVSMYRVQRRMRAVVGLLGALCGSVMLLGTAMLVAIGIFGVALAWLIAESLTAAALLLIDPRVLKPDAVRTRDLFAGWGIMPALRAWRAQRFGRRHSAQLARCVPPGMVLTGLEPTVTDVAVGRAVSRDGLGAAIIKLASTTSGAASLRREREQLLQLRADPRLEGWRGERPAIAEAGELDGHPYLVESLIAGPSIAQLLDRGSEPEPLAAIAFDAITGLHRRTAEPVTVDAALLGRWIDAPASVVQGALAKAPHDAATLSEITCELRGCLRGRRLSAGWIHGDFVPGNVIVTTDGREIAGIIDWELAAPRDLAAIDFATFALAARAQVERREIGQVVASALAGDIDRLLREALARARLDGGLGDALDVRSLTLLSWLRHAGAVLGQSQRYARHPVWKHFNLRRVLEAVRC